MRVSTGQAREKSGTPNAEARLRNGPHRRRKAPIGGTRAVSQRVEGPLSSPGPGRRWGPNPSSRTTATKRGSGFRKHQSAVRPPGEDRRVRHGWPFPSRPKSHVGFAL